MREGSLSSHGFQTMALGKRVDVGTDEEESRGGGGRSVAPVDHHLPSLHPRRPPPSSGTATQKLTRGLRPAFLGFPSSQRCGAGEDETKGGADFMGQSAPGPFQLVGNQFLSSPTKQTINQLSQTLSKSRVGKHHSIFCASSNLNLQTRSPKTEKSGHFYLYN